MSARAITRAAMVMTALALGAAPARATPPPDDAAVRKALDEEMARSMSELRLGGESPPYYMRYTLVDSDHLRISARLGSVVFEDKAPARILHVETRVGSPDEDNTNFRDAGFGRGGIAGISREDDVTALRRDLWELTDDEYKRALETLARKKASKAVQSADKEKIPDFAKAPVVQSVTDHAIVPTDAARAKMKELVVKLSASFRDFPAVNSGQVDGALELQRRRLLTSEKTWTDERQSHARIEVRADTIAPDGQRLSSTLSFSAIDVAGLPAFEKMDAEVRVLCKNLDAQRTAPSVEAGAATVLFEGPAAAQLARLLLAHPLSGQPVPRSAGESSPDGSTSLADKLGTVVAPKWLTVVDDPKGLGPDKKFLYGGYDTDDEGVPAERVTLIDHGVVKTLLMSRAPRKEITKSNGHGRNAGYGIRAAASNLFVTADGGLSRAELLASAARSAGKGGAVYVVRQLDRASGIGRGQTLQARVAFRVKDGKEEPVRGLSLEGFVPKKLKKDLIGAGKEPIVLDDEGVSVVTPALLFEDVDVGKPNDKNRIPPLYPSPLQAGSH